MILNPEDLNWCARRLPRRVKEVMKEAQTFLPVVAGGFIRACVANEKVNDVDMFVTGGGEKSCEELAMSLARIPGYGIPHKPKKTDNTWHLKIGEMPVQVIHRWTFDNPQAVIDSLDFTICQAVIWFQDKEWRGICNDSFYMDLAAKRLNYTAPIRDEDAGGSMLRVLKYYQRGYRIPLDSMGRVLARMISGISEENWKKREFMQGLSEKRFEWEKQVGLVLTGLLREVDPLIDADHVSHLPASEP